MSNKSTRIRNTMDGKRYLHTLRESIFFILNEAPRVQNLNLNFWKLKLQIFKGSLDIPDNTHLRNVTY